MHSDTPASVLHWHPRGTAAIPKEVRLSARESLKLQHTVTVRSVFEGPKLFCPTFSPISCSVLKAIPLLQDTWEDLLPEVSGNTAVYSRCNPCCSTLFGIQKKRDIFWPSKPGEFWFRESFVGHQQLISTKVNQLNPVITDVNTCNLEYKIVTLKSIRYGDC